MVAFKRPFSVRGSIHDAIQNRGETHRSRDEEACYRWLRERTVSAEVMDIPQAMVADSRTINEPGNFET